MKNTYAVQTFTKDRSIFATRGLTLEEATMVAKGRAAKMSEGSAVVFDAEQMREVATFQATRVSGQEAL